MRWAQALSCGCKYSHVVTFILCVIYHVHYIYKAFSRWEFSLNIWNHPQVNSPLTIWQKHKQSVIKRCKIDMICFFVAIIVFAGCKHFFVCGFVLSRGLCCLSIECELCAWSQHAVKLSPRIWDSFIPAAPSRFSQTQTNSAPNPHRLLQLSLGTAVFFHIVWCS